MDMMSIETEIWGQGYKTVAFVDEVGRGCLFGDVVAAAIVLPIGLKIDGVNDSKKLSAKKRESLFVIIKDRSIAIGIGIVSAEEIDRINIRNASKLAMKKAVEKLTSSNGEKVIADFIMIDAENIEIDLPQKAIIKGDSLSHGIAAASIIAKVTRDKMCLEWAKDYPAYGLEKHKGYATKMHKEALLEYGASNLHRRSFLKKILKVNQGSRD
ncbi:MAG: ribonuclease HII [Alkaliphilus sp.]|jgi:ribonuclease HII|nr:ribonuclease HII [Alkaliphilus transvaalensis]PHS35231.1 MAG: ribonuclease HII [Alkaliphilus sp.]